jgi:LDH2 family malate/lactate/ureidoglycolate dehydrogenase
MAIVKINYEDLYSCAYELLVALGENPEGAKVVADSMVYSDLRGVTTHGSYLLNPIANRVKASQLSLPTKAKVVSKEGSTAVVDGGNGLGPVAGKLAVDLSLELASKNGISLVLIRNTNTVGALAYYTEMLAKEGMIAMMGCNAAPAMAPWGGAEVFLGTNPIGIAAYTGHDLLFSVDMATSIVARGKIRKAAREGKPIPSDWALDSSGNLTTDPKAALEGVLLPMGGPKGSALALTVDILSGVLSGGMHAPNLKSFHELEGTTGVGATLAAIDIRKFMDLQTFKTKMDSYFASLKNLKKASCTSEIFVPGEIEFNTGQNNRKNGVPLEDKAVEALNQLLKQFAIQKHLG